MALWPATLPQFGQIGATVSADDSVARSSMDAGPQSRRNRYTAITKSVSYTMTLTGIQVGTLDVFFHDTLRNGALSFDWIDPRDDSPVGIAFKQPPKYTGIVSEQNTDERLWIASLSLEIQP